MLFWGLASFFKPNKISDSIYEMKLFLGLDFGDGYSVINHLYRNNHPDRPLSVELEVDEITLKKIKTHLESIVAKSEETVRGATCETTNIKKDEVEFTKINSKSHVNPDGSKYMYQLSSLHIDFERRVIEYSTSHY